MLWVLYTCLPSLAFVSCKKLSCGLVTLAVCLQVLVIFCWWLVLCAAFRVPYMNPTFYTHTLPNTVDFALYVLSGKATDNIPPRPGVFANHTRFARFESFLERINRTDRSKPAFVPPDMLVSAIDDAFDMDPDRFHKFDSVPNLLRDVALPRLSATRRNATTGNSIFVTNYEDRGFDQYGGNKMKRQYMAGLTRKDVMHYVSLCRPSMLEAMECLSGDDLPHTCIFDMVQEITFIVHTGKRDQLTDNDRGFIQSGASAFSAVSKSYKLGDILHMPWITQKHILKHDSYIRHLKGKIKDGSYQGLFKSLKDNGYKESDIMVEYLHNILALTLQWTILMEELLQSNASPSDVFLYEHLKRHPTAALVVSSNYKSKRLNKKPTHTVHILEDIMKDHKTPIDPSNAKHCPYAKQFIYTPEQAIVVQNTSIIETEGNWAFGRGYRRCAGEILTLEMMKEWIRIFKSVDFKYTRYQALDTFGFSYKFNATFTKL